MTHGACEVNIIFVSRRMTYYAKKSLPMSVSFVPDDAPVA
jgi:hypothetical protein